MLKKDYRCFNLISLMKKISLILLSIIVLVNYNCSGSSAIQEGDNLDFKQKEWASAQEINRRLGKGINIGNTFELRQSLQPNFVFDDMERIAGLGFSHVRIPINWERADRSSSTEPYTIKNDFFKTIDSVVKEALKNKLHVIINLHHHDAFMANPTTNKERFLSHWKQISDHFKGYPDSLLFEVLNEPHDKLNTSMWNVYLKEALNVIRKTNPKRCVLIGTAEWGGISGVKYLSLPNDPNIILTVHYYSPFQFTHQGASWTEGADAWLGTEWRDTETERQKVIDDFKPVLKLAMQKGIPIHIGEFGSYSKADMDSRVRWTRYLSSWFNQQGFSWAYWEWNAGFGIYDPKTKSYRMQLIDALLNDKLLD